MSARVCVVCDPVNLHDPYGLLVRGRGPAMSRAGRAPLRPPSPTPSEAESLQPGARSSSPVAAGGTVHCRRREMAGKQVMLAALLHDVDPADRLAPWEDHPVASR